MELRFRTTGRYTQHLTDFFMRESFDVVQNEHAPCTGRQHADRCFKVDRESWIGHPSSIHIEYVIEILHFFHAIHPATIGLSFIQHDVDRQPMEPCAERALSAKLAELVPNADEDVLGELFGARTVIDHARADRKDSVNVGPIESLEGTTIAGRSQRDLGVLPVKHFRIGFRAPDWHLYRFDHPRPVRV